MPSQAGKIGVKKTVPIAHLTLSINDNGSYVYSNTKSKLELKGQWNFIDSTSTLVLKSSSSHVQEFEIIKCNERELVIKNSTHVFVLRSSSISSNLFADYRGILGILVLVFFAFLISNNKKGINWRIPLVGISLQIIFAFSILKIGVVQTGFGYISRFFVELLAFTDKGSAFVFGSLVENTDSFGIIFAFKILPTVLFFSAFTSLLYYFGILQKIVFVFAWVMKKTMSLSGAESLAAASNVFIGQTEAPLVIKPYLEKMTKSEIMALMTGGMATIAGGVLAAYIGFLGGSDPEQQRLFATHLLTASIMNAPAALFIAKIMHPESEKIDKDLKVSKEVVGSNVLDALAKGTTDGLKLAVNVGAMLLVFTALMAMLNYVVFNWIGAPTGLNEIIAVNSGGQYEGLNMQYLLGMIFAPIAWLIGIPNVDLVMVGQLLGEKTILNEFYAYASMSNLKNSFLLTDPRSVIITTYALCGFANFASIGIQIGGISALAPGQRKNLSKLGLKALAGGTIASLLSASIAGMIIG
ncbi:MAG: Na+ dependent nucleoside transporter [Bacteroidetes bacterium]|nr:Na+ dependent nucleoside transporter [Bacteroidota bacterium]MBT4970900.1 Na+ dependent nucleoside transporter [Bacteroidota bacterium]